MSKFFNLHGLLRLANLDSPMFITLCCFINAILTFAYNQYHACCYYKREFQKYKPPSWRNLKANDSATIGRRIDFIEDVIKHEQEMVHSNVCLKEKFLDRALRKSDEWLMQHKLLNAHFERQMIQRDKQLWNNFSSNKQRLLNIVYTCVNNHIPTSAIHNYRKAVCYYLFLW